MSKELQAKYQKLQDRKNEYNNKVVSLETEVRTLKEDLRVAVTELMEKTGKGSYEEAMEYFNSLKAEVEQKAKDVESEIDNYLSGVIDVQESVGDDFFN